jgi:hypothetical protein
MPSPAEVAARTYVAAWQEPDRDTRARLIEACWAEDGRLVTGGREFRGRAALLAMMDTLFADPRGSRVKLVSAIDARGTIFRFRAVVLEPDGSVSPESFDAGQVGPDGRIDLILTFTGPLASAPP